MIGAVLLLSLLAAVAVGISRAVAAARLGSAAGSAAGDLRDQVTRLFRLGLLFAAVALVAEGLAGLVAELLPRGAEVSRDPAVVARALAFSVVGTPVLVVLGRWQRRCLAEDVDEQRSAGWAAYLFAMGAVSLVVGVLSADRVLAWLVGAEPLSAAALGRLLAWGAVWAVHWRLGAERDPGPGVEQGSLDLLFGSAVGLAVSAFSGARLLSLLLQALYDDRFLAVLVADRAPLLRRAAVSTAVGGLVWWWYWLRHTAPYLASRSAGRSRQRQRPERRWGLGAQPPATDTQRRSDTACDAFVLLGGVLGGLAAAVVGAARLLHAALQWFLGDPASTSAAAHFARLPAALAATVIGAAVWSYHRRVLSAQGPRRRGEIDRLPCYLGAAVGLVTTTAALTMTTRAALEAAATGGELSRHSAVANSVVLAATLFTVGVAVWGGLWRQAQRAVTADDRDADDRDAHDRDAEDGPTERRSVVRRVYLLSVLGASAAVGIVALVLGLIVLFEDLTRGVAGRATVLALRTQAGLVLSTGVVALYHGLVVAHDRAHVAHDRQAAGPQRSSGHADAVPTGPPVEPPAGAHEVIVASDADDRQRVAAALRASLGGRVRCWHLLRDAAPGATPDSPLDDDALRRLAAEVHRQPAGRVLVLQRAGVVEVLPFAAEPLQDGHRVARRAEAVGDLQRRGDEEEVVAARGPASGGQRLEIEHLPQSQTE